MNTINEDVASLAEAWIEIYGKTDYDIVAESPPSRRRGLKSTDTSYWQVSAAVASLAEAWIEMSI